MNYLLKDLRYAWHVALRSPGVTIAVVVMLALGTGGVTTIFNSAYSLISAPLPFSQPEQLVRIGGNIPIFNFYHSRFENREELGRIFSNLTAYTPGLASSIYILETGKYRHNVRFTSVAGEFFETLGVHPIRGNVFSRNSADIIISYRFWRDEFSRADDVIGKTIKNDIMQHTIVGIMPENFNFPVGTDYWLCYDGKGWPGIKADQLLGRLQPGMTILQATKELLALKFKPNQLVSGNDGLPLQSVKVVLYGDRMPLLFTLGTVSVLFLLLVCAGVMNLLVTQGVGRRYEMALRLIHGATRLNLIFKLLRETLPLVVVGALAGLWLSKILNFWLMSRFPMLMGGDVTVSAKMTFFVVLVFAVTTISGLAPAFYASGVDLNTYLSSDATFKRRLFSLREILTGLQLALALALLINMGLLLRNMMFNFNIPIGWSPNEIAVVMVQFPPVPSNPLKPDDLRRYARFSQEFRHQLNTIPGVVVAGTLKPIPFSIDAEMTTQRHTRVAYKNWPAGQSAYAMGTSSTVSPEGFRILNIQIINGRSFTETDVESVLESEIYFMENRRFREIGDPVIINQSLARQFWPGENVIGKTIYSLGGAPHEVVGVVQDFYISGNNKKLMPTLFVPSISGTVSLSMSDMRFLVRLHSASLMSDFRQRLSALDTGAVHVEVQSLADYTSDPKAKINLVLQFLGCFALLGIVVAGSCVYATTTIMMASRNRETGIRMALGAQSGDILRFALWRGVRAIIIGLPVGLLAAWILSQILAVFLAQVNINDSLVWIVSGAVLIGISAVAALIPALRATRVNPLDVLRDE